MKRLKKTVAFLAWSLFGLFITGFILESGTRLRFGPPLPDVLPDRETLFRYPENSVSWYWFTEDAAGTKRPIPFRTNALGLRDDPVSPKSPGEFRILMLGDSFTAGMAIERLEDTIPRQLQALLRQRLRADAITVINGGLGNSAPCQQLALLRRVADAVQPDLVMLQVYMSNDLSDTLSRVDLHLRAYNRQNFIRRVSFARVATGPGGELYMRLATRSVAWCRLAAMLGWDIPEIYARVMCRVPGTGVRPLPPAPPTAHRFWAVEPNLKTWYPLLELAYNLVVADIANIVEYCAERHIRLAGFALPCVFSADPERWEKELPEDIQREREPGKDARIGESLFAQRGIPYALVYDAMSRSGRGRALYHYYDMHLNEEGSRFTAEVLADFLMAGMLQEAGLVPASPPQTGPAVSADGDTGHEGH